MLCCLCCCVLLRLRAFVGYCGVCVCSIALVLSYLLVACVIRSKRLRVYVQNVPVFAGTTRTCVSTCARGAGTHEDFLNVHMEAFFSAPLHTPHPTHHNTRHNTQDTTHGDRERESDRDRERRERGEYQDRRREDPVKRRDDQEKRREEKIKRSREDQDERDEKRDTMCCVCGCVVFDSSWFFLFSKLPNTRIFQNFQNYQLPTLKTFFSWHFFLC